MNMNAGIGISIIEIKRFEKVLKRRGDKFLKRLFTQDEIDYCMKKKNPAPCLAARFAAKMSVLKALGKTVRLNSISITRGPLGEPLVKILGHDSPAPSVSMSHEKKMAAAIATTPNGKRT